MSEADEPKDQAEQPVEHSSGAEALAPSSQAPPAQPPPSAQPAAAPAPKRPAHTVKTWIAAAVGAVLLIGGGLGGYFIGAANDDDNGRPGIGTYRHHAPEGFRDGPPRWRDAPRSDR